LNQAREKAKSMSCKNNLKQIGMMIGFYVDANESILPPSLVSAPNWPGQYQWISALVMQDLNITSHKYYKTKFPRCPSTKGYYQVFSVLPQGWIKDDWTYAYNPMLHVQKITKLKRITETLSVTDNIIESPSNSWEKIYAYIPSYTNVVKRDFRHGSRTNNLWLDGHVSDMILDELRNGKYGTVNYYYDRK
jgi:prepilin-type processing-associated H-X9-DG protein